MTHLLFLLAFCLGSAHALDPSIQWRIIDTEHFSIVYDARQEQLGQDYARFAEQAFALTTEALGETPANRTVVLIDDSTDLSNGLAQPIPYPQIRVYPVLPGAMEEIGHFGNWGLELLLHEYTHIINATSAHGFYRPLRWIFGTIISPQSLLPRWYLEGTAVEMETRLSPYGRLRSPTFYAALRALSFDHKWDQESLARANELEIPSYPFGSRPYLFGSFMMRELRKLGGPQLAADLNSVYSRRLPYWFISEPIKKRVGYNYTQVFAKVREFSERHGAEVLQQIKSAPPVRVLPQTGSHNHGAVISPDGNRLVYIESNSAKERDDQLVLLERPAGQSVSFADQPIRRFLHLKNVESVSWLPDSRRVVFDAVDVVDLYYIYSDLYLFDFESARLTRLTHRLRASQPVVSADGKTVVFRQNLPGAQALAALDLGSLRADLIYQPEAQVQLSNPQFIDARRLIFSELRQGLRHLKVLDLNTHHARTVLGDYANARFPRVSYRGLLFTSDRTGINNIYLASLSHLQQSSPARAISNTPTEMITPELDTRTGELYVTNLTGDGYKIAIQDKDALAASPPQIDLGGDAPYPPPPSPPPVSESFASKPYSPWRYLVPRYWTPYIYFIDGGFLAQASITANDPPERHSYLLQAANDSIIHRTSYAAQYENGQTPVRTQVRWTDNHPYLYNTATELHSTEARLSGTLPLMVHWDRKWQAGLGWSYASFEVPDFIALNNSRVFTYRRTGPSLQTRWSSNLQRDQEVSPTKGSSLEVEYTTFLNSGAEYRSYQRLQASGQHFWSRYLPKNHSLMGQIKTIVQPGLRDTLLGATNSSFQYQASLLASDFLMRGYSSGEFIARHLLAGTLEYRFPLWLIEKGFATLPLFARRMHGAVIADAVTIDGAYYNFSRANYQQVLIGRGFVGSGAELRTDFTVGYGLPVQLVAGLYYASDGTAAASPLSFLLAFGL